MDSQRNDLSVADEPPLRTRYMEMSVQAHQIKALYNFLAAFFAWLTLAGYVVLPTTFTSIQNADSLRKITGGKVVQYAVRNVQILPLAGVLCFAGTAGSGWLWWKWRRNYIWLISRIFVPGLSHALLGLLATVINIVTTQNNHLSPTAKVTVIVTVVFSASASALILLYNHLLKNVIEVHVESRGRRPTHVEDT